MSNTPKIDDSEFPLVVVTFRGVPDREMFGAYFERMSEVMKRGRIAFIVDIRDLAMREISPALRQEFFKRVGERDASAGVGRKFCEAIVTESAEVRSLIASYMWQVQPRGYETRVLSSLEEARSWALARIAEIEVRETG